MHLPCSSRVAPAGSGPVAALVRFVPFAVLAALSLLFVPVPSAAVEQDTTVGEAAPVWQISPLRADILDLLANEPRLPLPVKQRREALLTYYGETGGPLLWLGTGHAPDLVARLRAAADEGLNPDDYPSDQLERLAAAIPQADRRSQAVIELHLSAAFLEFASDLQVGRFLPSKVDPNFFLQARQIDPQAALTGLANLDDVGGFFDRWRPPAPQYAALKRALVDYRAIADAGGWQPVPIGDAIKPGMTDPRVPALRTRLAVTDGITPTPAAGEEQLYDDALVAVVQRFQDRHGLDVDGVVGPATIGALNVPVEVRIANLVLGMERWRWMPNDLGQHHIMVNIAGFELQRVRSGAIEERMAVVVGQPYHRTPVFSDRIRYLEFNPYWNVPISIALNEELPKLRSNPGALAANGFEVVYEGKVYDVRSINWNQYGPGNFPFQLRQRPGPNNALGRVKFMFPNRHNVYLHDTPARSLFGRSERAFSHGCIRLARPLDLADQVLEAGAVDGWDPSRIDALVATAERTVINLNQSLPVHITYLTAWVEDGTPNFRKDIYNHDEKLLAALEGKTIAW